MSSVKCVAAQAPLSSTSGALECALDRDFGEVVEAAAESGPHLRHVLAAPEPECVASGISFDFTPEQHPRAAWLPTRNTITKNMRPSFTVALYRISGPADGRM